MNKKTKLIIAAIFFVIAAIAIFDAIDPFNESPYRAIPHGDHVHYVPVNKDPDAHLDDFPTQLPPPNMMIAPDGRVIPRDSTD